MKVCFSGCHHSSADLGRLDFGYALALLREIECLLGRFRCCWCRGGLERGPILGLLRARWCLCRGGSFCRFRFLLFLDYLTALMFIVTWQNCNLVPNHREWAFYWHNFWLHTVWTSQIIISYWQSYVRNQDISICISPQQFKESKFTHSHTCSCFQLL